MLNSFQQIPAHWLPKVCWHSLSSSFSCHRIKLKRNCECLNNIRIIKGDPRKGVEMLKCLLLAQLPLNANVPHAAHNWMGTCSSRLGLGFFSVSALSGGKKSGSEKSIAWPGSHPRTWKPETLQRNIRVQNNQIQFIKDSKTNKESMAANGKHESEAKQTAEKHQNRSR